MRHRGRPQHRRCVADARGRGTEEARGRGRHRGTAAQEDQVNQDGHQPSRGVGQCPLDVQAVPRQDRQGSKGVLRFGFTSNWTGHVSDNWLHTACIAKMCRAPPKPSDLPSLVGWEQDETSRAPAQHHHRTLLACKRPGACWDASRHDRGLRVSRLCARDRLARCVQCVVHVARLPPRRLHGLRSIKGLPRAAAVATATAVASTTTALSAALATSRDTRLGTVAAAIARRVRTPPRLFAWLRRMVSARVLGNALPR